MGLYTGTFSSYPAEGEREDLQDMIFDISPTDTPFISSMGRGRSRAIIHEWQTDSLANAVTNNQQFEGDDLTAVDASDATVKVGNVCEIARKSLAISGTLEAIDKAGRQSELAYQLAKRGKEIKRDMETALLDNHAPVSPGATNQKRVAAPLRSWLQTNTDLGGGSPVGANSGHTSGVPSAAATDAGTKRAFTETIAKTVIESIWTNGGEADVIMVGPFNKQAISTGFSGIATRNYDLSNVDPSPTASIASIDVYVSDFGTFKVVPNRFQREQDGWFLDFDYLTLNFLRPMQTVKLAKTGDAEKRMLLCEYTLCVKNEAALGIAADLTTA